MVTRRTTTRTASAAALLFGLAVGIVVIAATSSGLCDGFLFAPAAAPAGGPALLRKHLGSASSRSATSPPPSPPWTFGEPHRRLEKSLHRLHQSSSSSSSSSTEADGGNRKKSILSSIDVLPAKAWALLVIFAVGPWAPGSLGSPEDSQLLANVLADPVHPEGMNTLYYAIFNFFAVVPLLLAALAVPQSPPAGGKGAGGIPSLPFLAASIGIGYFAVGPYLAFKPEPIRDSLAEKPADAISWFAKNVLESKIFAGILLLFTLYLFVGGGVLSELQNDPEALLAGFVEQVSSSRFAAVSLADLTLLYLSCLYLTPDDYRLRNADATDAYARTVAALTAFLPFVGSLLYLLWRPQLPSLLREDGEGR